MLRPYGLSGVTAGAKKVSIHHQLFILRVCTTVGLLLDNIVPALVQAPPDQLECTVTSKPSSEIPT